MTFTTTTTRAACFSLLTLTAALAHAGSIATSPPVLTRASAPTTATTMTTMTVNMPTQIPQMSPPDLAMVTLTPSKMVVNRMEPFKLAYTIKNVGNKAVASARIRLTADYYALNSYVDIGPLAAGAEKSGMADITVMKDSMMNMSPEPYPVHITFKATAQVVGANQGAAADLNPGNDMKAAAPVTANPG
ncbi:MAG: CARDB domain-containing protein [Pseudomonadota bacterium]